MVLELTMRKTNASLFQPASPGAGSPTVAPREVAPQAEPTNPVPFILGVVIVLIVAVVVIARKQSGGSIYQRHAAIIGGLVTFSIPFAWGGISRVPTSLPTVFIVAAIASIPGLMVGYFLGKKEPASS